MTVTVSPAFIWMLLGDSSAAHGATDGAKWWMHSRGMVIKMRSGLLRGNLTGGTMVTGMSGQMSAGQSQGASGGRSTRGLSQQCRNTAGVDAMVECDEAETKL